ncbi:hypothetical protein [Nocardia sp. CA-120079]
MSSGNDVVAQSGSSGGPAAIGNVPAPPAYEFWEPTLFVDGTG